MIDVRRPLWHEPRPAEAPPVGGLDLLLAGAYGVVAVVESALRPGLVWRPAVMAAALVLVPALVLRRRRPLVAALAGWGAVAAASLMQLAAPGDVGLDAMLVVLVLLHSLVRWGSGREIVVGLPFVAAVVMLGMVVSAEGAAEVFGGTALLLLVVAFAAALRYRADLWRRQQREIRNDERVALARDLHDTVAHHVSAIAVQAQAGGVVAATHPEKAAQVLAAIESEASRALAEMRSVVRALREHPESTATPDDLAPQRGVADLPALARDGVPVVEVKVGESLGVLPPEVDASLHRLAQESVTNALRHARSATRVGVEVSRRGDVVQLRVVDDGRPGPVARAGAGFGLLGMAERVHLLGGRFAAGPGPDGGWLVDVDLPASGPGEQAR